MKNGMNLQVNTRSGYVDYGSPKVEPMFPTGFSLQANGTVETPEQRVKRITTNQKQQSQKIEDHKHLLPAGITLRG